MKSNVRNVSSEVRFRRQSAYHKPAMDLRHGFVRVDGIVLHYADIQSSKPVMVLLHGIGMDWRVWQAVSRRLAPYFHLFLLDLRGHGGSGKPASGYGLADYAADVEHMIDDLELEDVTLVGSSLGAMVAVAVEAPSEAVSRRILVDPPLFRGVDESRELLAKILDIKRSGMRRGEQQSHIFDALCRRFPEAGPIYLGYMAKTWTVAAVGVLEEALTPLDTARDIENALASIDVPTLVMRGNRAHGAVLSEEDAKRGLELLPHGEEQFFAGAGHAIHGSQPARFVDSILDFAERGGFVSAERA